MGKILTCNGLSKMYDTGRIIVRAVKNADLAIEENTINLITGKSGSGKTTLLNMLAGIDQPSTGNVILNGVDFYSQSEKVQAQIRGETYGFIFQSFYLLQELTVEHNIKTPCYINNIKMDKLYYNKLIERLDIFDLLNKYPAELSGGEQQRVAIARAMIGKPQIIFADEPTGNLDSVNTENVATIFGEFNSEYGTTFLVVSHDHSLIKSPDLIINIKDGEVIAEKG